MTNKKYFIIGILAIILIALFVLFSHNNQAPNSSILEKGVKNLTRETAADMIESYLKVNPKRTMQFYYLSAQDEYRKGHEEGRGNYRQYLIDGGDPALGMLEKLEQAGLIEIVARQKHSIVGDMDIFFNFTEKAKPYIIKEGDGTPDNQYTIILLGEVVNVEVSGITEGEKQRIADFTAEYKTTPFGEIIKKEESSEEVKSQMPFILYDDGWRISS